MGKLWPCLTTEYASAGKSKFDKVFLSKGLMKFLCPSKTSCNVTGMFTSLSLPSWAFLSSFALICPSTNHFRIFLIYSFREFPLISSRDSPVPLRILLHPIPWQQVVGGRKDLLPEAGDAQQQLQVRGRGGSKEAVWKEKDGSQLPASN